MKLKILFIASGLFLLTTSISSQEWKVFDSESGEFSILTPGLMESRNAVVETGVGDFKVNTLYINPKDTLGNYLYLINFYDLPEDMVPKDSTELVDAFFRNTMDQNISDTKGQLLYSNPIQIGDHPGFLWRSKSEKGYVKSRAYLINNRFYMLQVFSVPSKALNDNVDKFLDSFTIKS